MQGLQSSKRLNRFESGIAREMIRTTRNWSELLTFRRSMPKTRRKSGGIRSIERTIRLLREMARFGRRGARLSDLVVATRLGYATAHRILKCLVDQELAEKDPRTRRYSLGQLIYELGLGATPKINLREICEPVVSRIAERTGDTVFLHIRSGLDVLCVDRKEGTSPIKTHVFDIGSRRPLGVGAGGIALLAALPQDEVEEIVSRIAPRLSPWRVTPKRVLMMVARAKRDGYVATEGAVVKWVNAVSVPFGGQNGLPQATITIATIPPRLPRSRQHELVAMLRAGIREIERLVKESSSAGR